MPGNLVSIHVPARGTTLQQITPRSTNTSFNPRSREGNDRLDGINAVFEQSFNPRSREGNDQWRRSKRKPWLLVSIHVPARGTTEMRDNAVKQQAVSIHVPARGTTDNPHAFTKSFTVSIHVPARGTTILRSISAYPMQFQSTFPRGERQTAAPPVPHQRSVSIHVPARGTTKGVNPTGVLWMFQSTFPRGERLRFLARSRSISLFQSTFPRGERRPTCDPLCIFFWVSIHVPARGTTQMQILIASVKECFNPRSREGNDERAGSV